ncbi:MAG: hypothetical protein WC546_04340 [Candidatus Omnitrophota bacterium]
MNSLSDFKVETCAAPGIDGLLDFFKKIHDENIYFPPQDKIGILSKYRKYEDNSGKFNLFLLKYKGKDVVGCSGYVPFMGMLGSEKLTGFIGSDTIVESDFKKRFPNLAMMLAHSYENLIRKDRAFALVCPVNKAVSDSFKKVQWAEFAYIYKFTSNWQQKLSRI